MFKRPPDIIIGDDQEHPYLLRWWVIPRNHFFNIYLHKMLRDDQQDMHDHPWWNISIILKGGFHETQPAREYLTTPYMRVADLPRVTKFHGPGTLVFRRATTVHRLSLPSNKQTVHRHHPGYSWSLFITGRNVRTWGFHCKWGFRPWREYLKPPLPGKETSGQTGAGCN
jgi:hypothetical protein